MILGRLREEKCSTIRQVAATCNETRKEGHQLHAFLIDHFPVMQAGAPGDPKFMRPLEGVTGGEKPIVKELQAKLRADDLLFFLGSNRRPTASYRVARQAGARIGGGRGGNRRATRGRSPA